MDYSHQAPLSMGILQARILEWVAMPSSRRSSHPRDPTQVSALQVGSLQSEPPGKPRSGSGTHPNPGWLHLELLILITLAKALITNKMTIWGSDRHIFCMGRGGGGHSYSRINFTIYRWSIQNNHLDYISICFILKIEVEITCYKIHSLQVQSSVVFSVIYWQGCTAISIP